LREQGYAMTDFFDLSDPLQRKDGIEAAVRAVSGGQLVVMPTDTVYGLGADAFSRQGVAVLLAAKGRGREMPVPVLVGSWATLNGLVSFLPVQVEQLVEAFWPGGLTLIMKHAPSLSWDLGDTDGTVAVRMPSHPVALQILERTGPMAVSSANRSGKPPAATAAEAQDQLGGFVDVYLEAGELGSSLPSTIVDMTVTPPRVVRLGAVGMSELREVVPNIATA
jgi:L-threonylcarbamoyladenylate synthase